MQHRPLGRTGMTVSPISFGAWAIGGSWGPVDDEKSMAALHAAVDAGTNFIDTADVYGDGHSERLVARLRRERPSDPIFCPRCPRRPCARSGRSTTRTSALSSTPTGSRGPGSDAPCRHPKR
jgi:hypothetical protein